MSGWTILFFIVVGSIITYNVIKGIYNEAKEKAVEAVEKEYALSDKIAEVKAILSQAKFFNEIAFTDSDPYSEYFAPDKTIGLCPKCGIGFLQVDKKFTGMDSTYGKYPTYQKFIRCSECSYTESYVNLKRRRSSTKLNVSVQFKEEFNKAYRVK